MPLQINFMIIVRNFFICIWFDLVFEVDFVENCVHSGLIHVMDAWNNSCMEG
jgi:hypothetical protein